MKLTSVSQKDELGETRDVILERKEVLPFFDLIAAFRVLRVHRHV